ncbi:MAG: ABC transporter ATP-binding protein [Thiotrichales bacterium]|nr:ABC transporter ATP-binding protein [Thiotrichales bacterium]
MKEKFLQIEQVDMIFGQGAKAAHVLDQINLTVNQGEFISIIGHSGCGKSTILNVVAGLLDASSGFVLLDDKEIKGPGPERSVVFQNHSLLPWLTVYENVALAVNKAFKGKMSAQQRHDWILRSLDMVHMSHALDRLPSQISGGMKQRVGIARALSLEPKVLLLDEPFGALDALTRAHLQDEVMRIQGELNSTVMMITHDVDEAVLLSDRIVMMTNGPKATIGEILSVNLPKPRNRIEMADNPEYNRCRQAVLSFLYEKQAKVEL